MKKLLKKLVNFIVLVFTFRCDEAVLGGVCDFSGQGRDEFGR